MPAAGGFKRSCNGNKMLSENEKLSLSDDFRIYERSNTRVLHKSFLRIKHQLN